MCPGIDGFAIKISPGFFDNPKLGLPSVNGMMVLLSATTGLVEALLLDNGYLTDVRTAAAGAVAAKHLSRPDVPVAAIFGAGVQARLQLEALTLVRPIRQARDLGARRREGRSRRPASCARSWASRSRRTRSGKGRSRGADIVVTTTPSSERRSCKPTWLRPGQHITAMGSDAEHKNELEPAILARADLYVADSLSADAAARRTASRHRGRPGGGRRDFAELGADHRRPRPGRPSTGRHHHRRPDRHRRAGHRHRHACPSTAPARPAPEPIFES